MKRTLLIAACATMAISSSLIAAEAPRNRANPANVRWQDDPTVLWGVATMQARTVTTAPSSSSAATKNNDQVVAEDHDRGRNPGPPPEPPPRRREPPGRRSPHK